MPKVPDLGARIVGVRIPPDDGTPGIHARRADAYMVSAMRWLVVAMVGIGVLFISQVLRLVLG